ncbi:KOW domain-containing RNA-binding protein [Hymenobacter crusticola]|uniref:Uncharacterized protein n=1 Tax=Hymenobacter crusticola TaxID=1770526 RepID=A0A243W5G9_9BACT|nr:hypothetical protein [Hymenobacter crusticola]OUJ68604.1 hypothetical protein BXP70_27800 [Hymenobacter crusticola]
MAEEPFLVRDIIEVLTGRYKGRQGLVEHVPTGTAVFYTVSLWARKSSGRKGQADYLPSAPQAKPELTFAQMKLVQRGAY